MSWTTISGGVLADSADFGHMGGWGWGMAISGWLVMLAIIGLIVWLVVTTARRPGSVGNDRTSAIEALDARYVRGEIDRDEYLQKRADLEG